MSVKNLRTELGYLIPLVDAAPFFGVSPRTLRAMCDAGEVAHKKEEGKTPQGNRYLIPESAIRADRRLNIRHAA